MDKIQKFEDLKVWKDSMQLTIDVYRQFHALHDFGFRDQIQRASVSIPSTIAEGYERQTNKEFIQFLYIAKGSCGELRTQIYLGMELALIEKDRGMQLLQQTKEISAMLYGLIQTRKRNF